MDDPCDQWFAPQPMTVWDQIGRLYQRWFPLMMLLCALARLVFVYWVSPPNRPPVGTYIAVLAFLAAIVTIWPPESRWSKAAWLGVFFALMGLEVITLYQQHNDDISKEKQNRIDEDDRFAGILRQNQSAFDATMSGMKGLADLSRNALNATIGGETFSYLLFLGSQPDHLRLSVFSQGKYPLYDLHVRIVDLKLMKQIPATAEGEDFLKALGRSESTLSIGNLAAGAVWTSDWILPFSGEDEDFNVFFDARNGFWTEELRYRGPPQHRTRAIRVFMTYAPQKVLYERIDKDFPKDAIDWNKNPR